MPSIRQSTITKALSAQFGCALSAYEEWQMNQQGIYLPTSSAAFLGLTYHYAIAYYYREKMAGNTPAVIDVSDYFAEAWDSRAALEDDRGVVFDKETPEVLRSLGQELLFAYFEWLFNYQAETGEDYQAQAIEIVVERTIVDDWVATTRLDLLTTKQVIVDHKTTGLFAFPSQKEIDADLQATNHRWMLGQPGDYEFHIIKKQVPKGSRVGIFRTHRTQGQLDWYHEQLIKMVEYWKTGVVLPTVGWQCGYCNLPCNYMRRKQNG